MKFVIKSALKHDDLNSLPIYYPLLITWINFNPNMDK